MTVDMELLERIGRELLTALGEDPTRPGLVDTPSRFARWWQEFIDYEPGDTERTFDVENADEMVVVTGIKVWSLCEHHLLPFNATVAVGYIPTGKVLGLSKFGRIAHHAAHRLQIQERLVQDIADAVAKATGSSDVAVIADGEHLCMTMRGVKAPATLRTSVLRGLFKDDPAARAEFMSIVLGHNGR